MSGDAPAPDQQTAHEMRAAQETREAIIRTAASVIIERLQFMRMAGITYNGQRDLYQILGYDRIITNKQFRDRFLRGGIAKRLVLAYPNACWRGGFDVVEDEDPKTNTKFEQAWKDLAARVKARAVLRRVDILAGLGPYAVLLVGGPGDFDQELPKGNGTPDEILYMTPFTGGGGPGLTQGGTSGANYVDATIQTFETDAASPRFGLPNSYMLRRLDVSSPQLQKPVHWSRIIHIAEGTLDNEVYGTPTLEAVWNYLDDLDKVSGGGAEAFWLRANQGLHLNVDADATLAPEEKATIKDMADEYQHQIRRTLFTRKMDVKPLGSDVANFSNPTDSILTLIAGTMGIPKRILTGSEMGELASSQDRDNWRDQINGRQSEYLDPYVVRPLIDRLLAYKYLPQPAAPYQVKFAHMQVLTEQERSAGALAWANTNKTMGEVVFTNDQIRDHWYEMEPLTPEERQPIAAPEKATTTEPAPNLAVAEASTLDALEAALREDDLEAVGRVLGMEMPK